MIRKVQVPITLMFDRFVCICDSCQATAEHGENSEGARQAAMRQGFKILRHMDGTGRERTWIFCAKCEVKIPLA